MKDVDQLEVSHELDELYVDVVADKLYGVVLALLIDEICDICQSYLSYCMLLLFFYPAIDEGVSVILLYPSASELFPRATSSRKTISFGLDKYIPYFFLFVEAEVKGDEVVEARGETESTEDVMRITRSDLIVSSLYLCIGFL